MLAVRWLFPGSEVRIDTRCLDCGEPILIRMRDEEIALWLDRRLRSGELARKPGTPDDLARRRGRMNPRLSDEWLRYLTFEDAEALNIAVRPWPADGAIGDRC